MVLSAVSLLGAGACEGQSSSDDPSRGFPGYPLVQCALMITDSPTDVALDGQGFLAVDHGPSRRYVRGGHYQLNGEGFLLDADYRRLQGYAPASGWGGVMAGPLQDISIASSTSVPRATTRVQVAVDLDSSTVFNPGGEFDATNAASTSSLGASVDVYDWHGTRHKIDLYYRHESVEQWSWHAIADGGDVGGLAGVNVEGGAGLLVFDGAGRLMQGAVGSAFFKFYSFGGENIVFDHGGVTPWSAGASFGATTESAKSGQVQAIAQDGYAKASLTDIEIQSDGAVTATFPGRDREPVAYIPVIWFRDFSGLIKVGANTYKESAKSGPGVPIVPGTNQSATILGSALEQSCDVSVAPRP
ncbi:MAG TPA: flagellar hook-basal body complex protein [Polyangia bacterium]|nr:flagellar hook-basal body complex protein [Polyangia bacterium]